MSDDLLVLGPRDVEALLDLDELVDALAPAMTDLSEGRTSMPPRTAAQVPERDAFLASMPAYVPSLKALTCKLVSVFPRNAGTALPTHQAVVLAFDPDTGAPVALLDGTTITAIRTAAGSALSARLLAREDASVLAILGTGVQARSHAQALVRVRPIREIRLAGRDRAKADTLARELANELALEVTVAVGYAEALAGADVVCATTHAAEPVVRREWLSPGCHVASIGFNPGGREVDDATVAGSLVCVEARAAALADFPAGSNDLLQPIHGGMLDPVDVVEIGELLAGTRHGRESAEQLTLYKSVGVAVQDAVAASLVIARAGSKTR